MEKHELEVCLSPQLFEYIGISKPYTAVIVDIFRATTSIVGAMDAGVKEIIPVKGFDEAKSYKEQGYLIAAEREGIVPDFADFGNSAFNFMIPEAKGKTIAYSTTNGTKITKMAAEEAEEVIIGSFSNIQAIADYVKSKNQNLLIFCAGYKNKFNLEDTIFAGALTELVMNESFDIHCDSAWAAYDLWQTAKKDVLTYIDKSSHRYRLRHLVSEELVEYTFKMNTTKVVPVLKDNRIVAL
ncbi:MAG: 2-phosphosulfolactate phosphatase [Hyphomicrobiales bacterium]